MTATTFSDRAGVVIVDYGSGNLRSAEKAYERAARKGETGHVIRVTADPKAIAEADRLVLPGVGAFADCAAGIAAVPGLRDALEDAVRVRGVPFLGICVGMQLLATRGHEHGTHEGFGWIGGEVVALTPSDPGLKVPHMGWNNLEIKAPHALFEGIASGTHAYFVHSYQFKPADAGAVAATVDYGGPVTAAVAAGNIAGTQFHPEKSQETGLRLIANFLKWTP